MTVNIAEGPRTGQTIVRILEPQPQTAEKTVPAPTRVPNLTPVADPTELPVASPMS